MKDFYDDVDNIVELNQKDAVKMMTVMNQKDHKGGLPNLLLAYVSWCSDCNNMVKMFKSFAQTVKDKKIPINIYAINMTKDKPKKFMETYMQIKHYPTIRLLSGSHDNQYT